MPRGTGTPNSRSTALAWYSWMFMRLAHGSRTTPPEREKVGAFSTSLAEIGGNLLARLNQAFDRRNRFLEHAALGAVELDLDHTLDPLAADDDGHPDVKIFHAILAVEPGRRR